MHFHDARITAVAVLLRRRNFVEQDFGRIFLMQACGDKTAGVNSALLAQRDQLFCHGTRGFRFEYSLTRKVDDVRLRGVAYGAVRNGELFVINYSAPRLAFFPKYAAQVEALAKTAKVKG